VIGEWESASLEVSGRWTESIVFSKDNFLYAGTTGTIDIWNPANTREHFTLNPHSYPVRSLTFSPDETLLISGSGDITWVWDVASRRAITSLKQGITSAEFSPDGTLLALVPHDYRSNTTLWGIP
jgi:WD40 repeat protein